jgi:hypothetical protein
MRQPRFLALYWDPKGLALSPTADITARAFSTSADRSIHFGSQCATKREIDELIDEMIQDLEDARKLAHERFEH